MMGEEKRTAPIIRFAGFTDAWKAYKLSNIVEQVSRTDEKSVAPIMMLTADNGFIDQSDRYSFNNAGKSLKKYISLKKGELAYNHGASKTRPYGSCFVLDNVDEARVPFVYHCFTTLSENPFFLGILLNRKGMEQYLMKLVSSGARMDGLLNISFEEYTSVPVVLPNKDEQNQIALLFKSISIASALQQRKLEQLQKLKKYFLQNMFPAKGEKVPTIRFKGFTGNWEQHKLGELGKIITGSTPSSSNTNYYSADGIPWVTPTDIVKNTTSDTKKKLSKEGEKIGRVVPAGTVLVTCIASIGKNTMLTTMGSFNQQINGLVPNKERHDPYFLLTESFIWSKRMKADASAGTMQIVNKKEFSDIETCVPSLSEQHKIGAYFKTIDRMIDLYQYKCDQAHLIKKFMLQNLFI